MGRYKPAQWRPLGPVTDEPPLRRHNKIIVHTMVGSLWGTDAYFRAGGFSGTESHFGVGYDGEVLQWQDTDRQADAQLEGNDDGLSIETADTGQGFPSWGGSNVPAWTSRQVDAIINILVWACRRYDIPARLIPDTEDATRGIGFHRQGIDPYRKHGEHYSESYGKVCPGDRRVRQIRRTVIPRVASALNGDDMTRDELLDALASERGQRIIRRAVNGAEAPLWTPKPYDQKGTMPVWRMIQQARGYAEAAWRDGRRGG